MSFLTDFFDINDNRKEVPVCCPFPHYTTSGLSYQESNASASVNTEENLFHCQSCGAGYSEVQFIQKVLDCRYIDAKRLQRCFDTMEDTVEWQNSTTLEETTKTLALNFGISEEVINELQIRTPDYRDDAIAFPVFMFGHLIDVRTYQPNHKPKVKTRTGCPSGLILPFDIWVETPTQKLTLICAGEKDMAIARTKGFNAITITGGELALPIIKEYFRDRAIAIVYDNDDTGHLGAIKLANELFKYTEHIKVVTNFHDNMENKEDITDYFMKYSHNKTDLINCISSTEWFQPTIIATKSNYPITDLLTASTPEYIGKMCRSNIQVTAVSEATFACPSSIIAEKYKITGQDDRMFQNEFRDWELNKDTLGDVLHLIDNNFKEDIINKNIRKILKILDKERCVRIKTLERATVFKAYVTDLFETTNTVAAQPMEYTVYSVGKKLESGQKYMVTYKLLPHPYKGQQLIMLVIDATQANDSVNNFTVTDETQELLKLFQTPDGTTLEEHMDHLIERVKGLLGYNGNNQLIRTIDLAYHTVLQFNFGQFKNIRGYLDTLIVGESRVGKSSTADCLRQTYGLGTFTSLAGNSATVPGLIGGSNKTASGFQTRAGVIPQNHRGLIIFEEFGKSNSSIITELTDIRSSNEVRITRVAGTITLPALVRMIALTNPKTTGSQIKSIASYPNGIAVLTELVNTAEDIARYDQILILSDKGNSQFDPLWIPAEPLSKEAYQARVRWVWSRNADDIVIDNETQLYIMQCANELNEKYYCHIKIFGTEAWKKLTRLAIAIAGYTVHTDTDFCKIYVTKPEVDLAVKYFVELYDNPTFKFKEFVEHERRYTLIDEDGIVLLQDLYDKYPTLILQLEQCSTTNKNILSAATGLTNDDLNKALNILTKGLFIRFANHEMIPTERFRLGVNQINRQTQIGRLGEELC